MRKSKRNNINFSISFFNELEQEYGREVVKECINSLKIEFFKQDEYVMRIGDFGDKFYIIVNGEVSVFINMEKDGQRESVLINTLKVGQTFGEMALISDKPRMASIKCNSECTFAALSKSDYRSILSNKQSVKLNRAFNFFARVTGIQNFNNKGLTMLYFCCHQIELKRRQYLYQKNQQAKYIYIIIRGDIKLNIFRQQSIQNICIVSDYEIVGDYEAFNNLNYQYNAECESEQALLYKINKKKFINIIQANYLYDVYKNILKNAELKQEHRQQQMETVSKPKLQVQVINENELIESTRTLYYSEKQHTYLSDTILVQANRQAITKILSRQQRQRPIINVPFQQRKAELDSNLRIRSISQQIKALEERKKRRIQNTSLQY